MTVFDPDEVLAVAHHLLTRRDEASNRSAVSRAYYGVFLRARDMANISDRHPRVHQWTQEYYEREGEKALGMNLRLLRESRNNVDYSTDRHVSQKDIDDAMKRSRQIRAQLQAIAGRKQYRGE
ncbi:hypothetical protein CDL60_12600 [Roseateles noduli]|nr:hypothetical protein CDL60_12600 [Roseateles noduli]